MHERCCEGTKVPYITLQAPAFIYCNEKTVEFNVHVFDSDDCNMLYMFIALLCAQTTYDDMPFMGTRWKFYIYENIP